MNYLELVLIGVGIVLFGAAAFLYSRDMTKVIFPIFLGVCGAFLCVAQTVKANIGGVAQIEFVRSVGEAAETNGEALSANTEAIAQLNTALSSTQEAFTAYRTEVDERFAELNQEPVPFDETAERLAESSRALQAQLQVVETTNRAAAINNDRLKQLTENVGGLFQ